MIFVKDSIYTFLAIIVIVQYSFNFARMQKSKDK